MPRVKTKWYQAGLNFECQQCGNCCSGAPGYVWVTKDEIKAIAEFLGRPKGTLTSDELRRVGLRHSLTEKPGGDCVFLIRKGGKVGCAIYSVRPKQCRTWPFWPDNLDSPDAWNETSADCPGMGVGRRYEFDEIEQIRHGKAES